MTAQKWSGPADASPICAGGLGNATQFELGAIPENGANCPDRLCYYMQHALQKFCCKIRWFHGPWRPNILEMTDISITCKNGPRAGSISSCCTFAATIPAT